MLKTIAEALAITAFSAAVLIVSTGVAKAGDFEQGAGKLAAYATMASYVCDGYKLTQVGEDARSIYLGMTDDESQVAYNSVMNASAKFDCGIAVKLRVIAAK